MLPHLTKSHSSYDIQDVNFGRFYKAATLTSRRLLREVFLLMLHRSHVSSERWPKTVKDYCLEVLSWSNKKYKDNFNADERSLLDQPLTSADFDVSLLTKLMNKLFSTMGLPQSYWQAVRDLKNVRNRVCHEHLVMDDTKLTASFTDLKILFRQLLNEAGDLFKADVEELLGVFEDEVDGIMACPLETETQEYFKSVQDFRSYLVGHFITNGRRELMTRYRKLRILNPFTWLSDEHFSEMLVDKVFTPLHLSVQGANVDVLSLLKTERLCEETHEGILPAVLVLSGVAGSGKTSFCRYVLHDWTSSSGGVAGLTSVDLVLHVEVRNVSQGSFVQFLKTTLLQETCSLLQEADIMESLQQMNVLYVIDGMDEAMADGRQLVEQILSVVGSSRVIITTRPEFGSCVVQAAQRHHLDHLKLDVKGLSAEGMTSFSHRVFDALEPQEEGSLQEFLKFLQRADSGLGDHLKLPLTLVLLITLWREDRSRLSQVTSATRLYSEIFRMCTMKLTSRLGLNQMEVEPFVEGWLLQLGKEAYRMLEDGEYVLSDVRRRRLMSLCSSRSIDPVQVLSAFLMCEVKEDFKGVKFLFSYIHRSQMEYLAGLHLAEEITKDPKSLPSLMESLREGDKVDKLLLGVPLALLSNCMEAQKWSNTLRFVVGHLCTNEAPASLIREVLERLLESRCYSKDIPALWQLVQESDCNPVVCQMASSAVTGYSWQPSSEDLCNASEPTLRLLQYTDFAPEEVFIRIVDWASNAALLSDKDGALRKATVNLRPILTCLAQRPRVKVGLSVEQDFYDWGRASTTDGLLTTLLPGGDLTYLMGHLGTSGAASLSAARGVSEAHVRITEASALRALSNSLDRIDRLVLRLDLHPRAAPSELPDLSSAKDLSLVLRGLRDEEVLQTAGLLARLSRSYRILDFVGSNLSPEGGRSFLRTLSEQDLCVKDKLTIRSVHKLEESAFEEMKTMIQCQFNWWS